MYKPKGIYFSKAEYVKSQSDSDWKIIEKGYQLNYKEDVLYQFINDDLIGEASFEMKEVWIARIKNGSIITNLRNAVAISDNNGKLIDEVTFSYEKNEFGKFYHAPVSKNYFHTANDISKPKKVRGTVFSMLTGGGKNFNFYHWFLDSLSRLGDLELAGWNDEIDYYLVPEYVQNFQKESLQLLGIPSHKIISSIENKHVIADYIIASSHPRTATYCVRKSSVEFLHKKFNHVELVYDINKKYPKKFFISRNDAPRRRVINEDELSQMLKKFDIDTIQISDYTFQEVIYLFRNAEVVISPHSAALTNMLFTNLNLVKIFEIFPTCDILPYYYELAKELGIEYNYIVLDNKFDNNIKSRYDVQNLDVFIDTSILLGKLEQYENQFN